MPGKKPRSVVLLSGGMDSSVCAALAVRDTEAAALHISYGQRTEKRERAAFERICDRLGVKQRLVIRNEALSNAHFLSMAVSWAEVLEAEQIYIGAVEQDSSGYPDCRPAYYKAFNAVIQEGTREGKIEVVTPLIALRKAEIVKLGLELGAPFDLTWSCYSREDKACGVCESCVLRLRAFQEANARDPLPYMQQSLKVAGQ